MKKQVIAVRIIPIITATKIKLWWFWKRIEVNIVVEVIVYEDFNVSVCVKNSR